MCHSKRILLDLTQTYVVRIWTTRSPKGRSSLMRLINGLEWDGTSLAQSILNQARAHTRPWNYSADLKVSVSPTLLLYMIIWIWGKSPDWKPLLCVLNFQSLLQFPTSMLLFPFIYSHACFLCSSKHGFRNRTGQRTRKGSACWLYG